MLTYVRSCRDTLKRYLHMFKDLKNNINKRSREIEDIKEDHMGLLELGNTGAEMKILLNVINSSLILEKISECEDIQIETI